MSKKEYYKTNILPKEKEILSLPKNKAIELAYKYADKGTRFQNIDILNMKYENQSIASVVSSKWHFGGFTKEEFSKIEDKYQAATSMFSTEQEKLIKNIQVLNAKNSNNKQVSQRLAELGYRFRMGTLNKLENKFDTILTMLSKTANFDTHTADGYYHETICLNENFIEDNSEVLSLKNEKGELLFELLYKANKNNIKPDFLNYLSEENSLKMLDLMFEDSFNFHIKNISDLNEDIRKKVISKIKDNYDENELIALSFFKENKNMVYEVLEEKIKNGFKTENEELLGLRKINIIGLKKGKSISDEISNFLTNKNKEKQKVSKDKFSLK